ncbi:MAG: 4Fe-4S binding protein [Eubacteriales bacterium]|nr:4Fe-4S binding protein [Eubacteriales bacterium]
MAVGKRKAWIDQKACVACGCCARVCPKGAIHILRGVYAQVNEDQCVGCGLCAKACPASVIEIREAQG